MRLREMLLIEHSSSAVIKARQFSSEFSSQKGFAITASKLLCLCFELLQNIHKKPNSFLKGSFR